MSEPWDRWLTLTRLQGEFVARSFAVGNAALDGLRRRSWRLFDRWLALAWPLFAAGAGRSMRAGTSWADLLEDESRNLAQAWVLGDAELRDWGGRFARVIDGERVD